MVFHFPRNLTFLGRHALLGQQKADREHIFCLQWENVRWCEDRFSLRQGLCVTEGDVLFSIVYLPHCLSKLIWKTEFMKLTLILYAPRAGASTPLCLRCHPGTLCTPFHLVLMTILKVGLFYQDSHFRKKTSGK